MKLWEALEKSNKVRRKAWSTGLYMEFMKEDTRYRAFEVSGGIRKEVEWFPVFDVMSENWEPFQVKQ